MRQCFTIEIVAIKVAYRPRRPVAPPSHVVEVPLAEKKVGQAKPFAETQRGYDHQHQGAQAVSVGGYLLGREASTGMTVDHSNQSEKFVVRGGVETRLRLSSVGLRSYRYARGRDGSDETPKPSIAEPYPEIVVLPSDAYRYCAERFGLTEREVRMALSVYNIFNVQRHLICRATLRRFRAEAHQAWNGATAAA
jgi:hypothetical protein